MRLSIRLKLLLSYIFILLLASGLVGFVFYLNEQYIRAQQITILDEKAQVATERIQDYFTTIKKQQLEVANTVNGLEPQYVNTFEEQGAELLLEAPSIESLSLLSATGEVLSEIPNEGGEASQGSEAEPSNEAFNKALSSSSSLSDTYFIDNSSTPYISIYTPVLGASNQVLGVIKSEVKLSFLAEVLSSLRLGEHGSAYIVDMDGQLIAHPHKEQLDAKGIANRPLIQKLITAGYSSLETSDHYYDNEHQSEVIASSTIVSDLDWIITVEQPTSVVFDQLTHTRNLLMVALITALILMLMLAFLISAGIARPIGLLMNSVRRIHLGDLASRSDVNTNDELEDLSTAFNDMAEQLSERQDHLQKANNSLMVERDRQEALLQSLSDGVIALDEHGVITLFNAAAEKITGYSQKSMLGRNINAAMQLYLDEELLSYERYTSQQPKEKQVYRDQGLTVHTDLGQKVLSLRAIPLKVASNKDEGWVITFTDMTKERDFEAMKLDFVSMAAHELRTPLTALRGYLSLIQDEASEKLNDDERKYLDRSFISANQLSALVENLLNLSRVERGALKLSLSPISLEKVIQDVVDNLSSIAKQKDIGLFFEASDQQHLVMADLFRLGEVITNLVANGINYTAYGGWVKVEVKAQKGAAEVSVSDNGQGIPAASIPHLFTKFYRVQSTLAMGSKGTGLGLYISKAIIEAHHGKIWVESIEGKGSTFTFTVPLADKPSSDDKKSDGAPTKKRSNEETTDN